MKAVPTHWPNSFTCQCPTCLHQQFNSVLLCVMIVTSGSAVPTICPTVNGCTMPTMHCLTLCYDSEVVLRLSYGEWLALPQNQYEPLVDASIGSNLIRRKFYGLSFKTDFQSSAVSQINMNHRNLAEALELGKIDELIQKYQIYRQQSKSIL